MPENQNIDFTLGQGRNVFARYPFLPLAFVLMTGIFVGEKFSVSLPIAAVAMATLILLLFALAVRRRGLRELIIYALIFVYGLVAIDLAVPARAELPKQKMYYSGIVDNTPRIRQKTTQVQVKLFACGDSSQLSPLHAKVLLYLRTSPLARHLHYGDSVIFRSQFRPVHNLGNPYEFDYQNYLRLKGIYYTAFVDTGQARIVGVGGGNRAKLWATQLRERLLSIYRRYGIKGKVYRVLAALTLGYRQALDRETLQSFSHAGAMHILAVSGLHVGILYGVLLLIFSGLLKTRWRSLALIIILLVLWGFALITGFSPSVRRSVFMFSVISLSMVTRFKSNVYNTLAASAFFLLLFYPTDLFSLGFWMSYLAVLAIVAVYPLLNNLVHLPRPVNYIWSLISVSVAAQVGTMPLAIYTFHQFPNYFILTNLFAIPLAAIILYLALLLFIIARLTFVATIVGYGLRFFVRLLLWAIKLTESLPGATILHLFITFGQMALVYVIVSCVILLLVYKKKVYLFASLLGILLFVGVNLFNKIRLTTPARIIVYNVPGHNVINFISPVTNVILTDTSVDNSLIDIYVLPYWKYAHLSRAKHLLLSDSLSYKSNELIINGNVMNFLNQKILILADRSILDNTTQKKLNLDYLMLASNVYTDIKEVSEFFNFRQIIFLSSCKQFRSIKWLRQADSLGLRAHDVITQGAFIQKIKSYD